MISGRFRHCLHRRFEISRRFNFFLRDLRVNRVLKMAAISADLSGDFGEIDDILIDSCDCGNFYGGCNVFKAFNRQLERISYDFGGSFL